MQIQSLEQNKFQQQNTQFKGAVSSSLRYLATNQAIGANLTDLSFMVIPRVWTDTKRNPDACLETARREASGTINHSSIGLYGVAGGALLSGIMGINKKFNIKANSMFTAPETLNILAENKAKQVKDNLQQIDYLKETLSNVKAYNPTAQNADKEGFVKLSQETIDDIAHLIDKSLKDETMTSKKWVKKGASDSLQVLINKIIAATGAESKYILESSDKKIISETNLKTLLEDIYKISDSFNKKDVLKTFEEPPKNVVFFILCTDASMLLETIRSRAQILRTRPLSKRDILNYIDNYVDTSLSKDAIEKIAVLSGGSLGYVLDMLDGTKSDVLIKSREMALSFVKGMLNLDTGSANLIYSMFSWQRDRVKELLNISLNALRDLAVVKKSKGAPLSFFTSYSEAYEIAASHSLKKILKLIDSITTGIDNFAVNASVPGVLTSILAEER